MSQNKLKFNFYGAAQEVTGSNNLLEVEIGGKKTKLLVDCGLFQGSKINDERNDKPFLYNPQDIDALVVTHAHLDHAGRIPKIVKNGFRGKIFSTLPTRDLSQIMLIDSLGILRKQLGNNQGRELIYTEEDVEKAMSQWVTVGYHEEFSIGGLKINLKEAGHILGSAIVEVVAKGNTSGHAKGGAKIVFSGDLGDSPSPLLNDAEKITDADFLVVESTYGNKKHEGMAETEVKLERIIEDTMFRNGVLMIPAFSLERTQKILFQINNLVEGGRIPRVPIFLDSPLSIKATEIYKKNSRYYGESAKELLLSGDDIFNFPGLKMTLATEESRRINNIPSPKIIIAGSGMCNGGRILHHLRQYLGDSKNTLLIVSFQVAGSLGRRLSEGEKVVKIFGEDVLVEADVHKIEGYSAHSDSDGLYDFVKNSADTLKKVFVNHGEPEASLFLVQKIRDCLGLDAVAPKFGDSHMLNF
ncbi:MBL fold metallo-hydrolase [Patescibacteria group bacterium]|nr:MBL fold metallo-hydrolase [Patescibacteria group bacterium]MBU4477013.1 MBL fold metallo-hydrolase [Patescibacteria group bacterium]